MMIPRIQVQARGWLGVTLAGCVLACSPTTNTGNQSPGAFGGAGQLSVAPPASDAGRSALGSAPPAAAAAGRGTLPATGGVPATVITGAAGTGAAGTSAAGLPASTSGPMPCNVTKVLARQCWQCHGASPIGGAPMSLVTLADLQAPAKTQPTLKVYQLSKQRIHDAARPMPQGSALSAEELRALDDWFDSSAPAGGAADATCDTKAEAVAGQGDGEYGPLTALPGETCYEFKTHASTTSVDNMPYMVPPGESYSNFYFKAPWPTGAVATRYGAKFDNLKVLHHWLLFSTFENEVEGAHAVAPLPTLIGVNATLLAGWAVGGTNLATPKDVGLELPAKGAQINIQWHHYNNSSTTQADMSAVQICTVPAGMRPQTASVTWLGTEDLGGNKWFGGVGMPAHQKSSFQGTCDPLREGMSPTDPIHIVSFWPHMHQLGTGMQTFVNRKNGTKELVFDKAFDFNHQIHYNVDVLLQPGETITAVCNFNNTTNMGVPFGESSDTEMCYQFTYAWPAHALENHVASLIGATNTCW